MSSRKYLNTQELKKKSIDAIKKKNKQIAG